MAFVSVHALGTGSLTLPERFFIKPADPVACRTVPSLSFLIQHRAATTNKVTRILFDLGLRRDLSLYPPPFQKHCTTRQPITTKPDIVESLANGGLTVNDIDYIVFSHVHYDHVGLPRDFSNPKTQFVVGPGTLDLLSGKSSLSNGSHSFFESDLLPLDRIVELAPLGRASMPRPPSRSSTPSATSSCATSVHDSDTESSNSIKMSLSSDWTPDVPPFANVIDFFGDASIFIVSAPGHLPGHVNLLARISNSKTPKYVLLAGDSCHDVRLLTGERDIATWTDETGHQCCIHADALEAKTTIDRLRAVSLEGIFVNATISDVNNGYVVVGGKVKAQVEVIFAHDADWEASAKETGRFWPGSV